MYNFSMETTLKRQARGAVGKPDVVSYLTGETGDGKVTANLNLGDLDADGRLILELREVSESLLTCFVCSPPPHHSWIRYSRIDVRRPQ